ncbi:MAG: hypothetical protein Q8L86_11670 [Vicinamibacterales bacterium]|nr:hypothetical protein [Vicinamibacterales bacterium]
MGDAAEGLIDADSRIQERMEELEESRRNARKPHAKVDPEKARQLESCRLARTELEQQMVLTTHPVRRDQITQAVAELDRRIAQLA